MGAMSRRKGAAGERELFALLEEHLGIAIKRNLEQTRGGGADSYDLPGYAIEVKRVEQLAVDRWWSQAVMQAGSAIPVLAYRQSRQPWRFVVPLEWVQGFEMTRTEYVATLGLHEFVYLVRENNLK